MLKHSLIIISCFLLFNPMYAAEYLSGNIVKVQQGDTVYSDVFAASRQANIFGFVQGDIFAACQVVTVEGGIGDDLLAGCRRLEIRGNVKDGVVGFAETIVIDGNIGGDVIAFCGSVRITDRALIKGNLYVGTGHLFFDGGKVGGTIKGAADEINLNGIVNGKVELQGRELYIGSDYQANKGTKLTLEKDFDEGKLEYIPADLEVIIEKPKRFYHSIFFFWSFLSLLITGVLVISLFKDFSRDYLPDALENPLKNIGLGFLIMVVTPIVILILMIIVLTIPIGLILLAVYLILLYISILFAALFGGDYLLKLFKKNGKKSLFWPLLLGVIIFILFMIIPIVGFLFGLIVISFGSGSLISYIWKLRKPAERTAS